MGFFVFAKKSSGEKISCHKLTAEGSTLNSSNLQLMGILNQIPNFFDITHTSAQESKCLAQQVPPAWGSQGRAGKGTGEMALKNRFCGNFVKKCLPDSLGTAWQTPWRERPCRTDLNLHFLKKCKIFFSMSNLLILGLLCSSPVTEVVTIEVMSLLLLLLLLPLLLSTNALGSGGRASSLSLSQLICIPKY